MKGLIHWCLCLCLLPAGLYAAKVDTVQVFSKAMHKSYKCVIITPDAYGKGKQRFPVLYLLHGHSGNYRDWVTKVPHLAALADLHHCLMVCPDGGYNSWYINSPVDSSVKFDTYVGTEIPAYIDGHYRTLADRRYRAIAGLSMGGHGALSLAIRHQQTFGAAGSMSGGVDIRPFPKQWELSRILGPMKQHRDNWDAYTVITQTDRLTNGKLHLIIDCGVKDFFLEVNRHLHQQLLQQGIDHDYIERPGGHEWSYWSSAIEYQLLFFSRLWEAEQATASR